MSKLKLAVIALFGLNVAVSSHAVADAKFIWRYTSGLSSTAPPTPGQPQQPGEPGFLLRPSSLPVALRRETASSNEYSFDFGTLLDADAVSQVSYQIAPFAPGERLPGGLSLSNGILHGTADDNAGIYIFRIIASGVGDSGVARETTATYSLILEDRIGFNLVKDLPQLPLKRAQYNLDLKELVDPASLKAVTADALAWSWIANPDHQPASMSGLPEGLSLSGGRIRGMPVNSGDYEIVLTASFDGRSVSGMYRMSVGLQDIAIEYKDEALPMGEMGVQYSADLNSLITVQNIPASGVSWQSSDDVAVSGDEIAGLPVGLDLNEETGMLSGLPTERGTFRFSTTAAWSNSQPEAEQTDAYKIHTIVIGGRAYRFSQMSLSTAGDHACGVTLDGGVQCWGNGGNGRLGTGNNISSFVPVDVLGLEGAVKQVTVGQDFTCALGDSGGVQCWGAGNRGRLGNGSTANSSSPVQVSGLTSGVAAIGAGNEFACALLVSGSVRCWGYGVNGNLGNGDTADSSSPVTVLNVTNAKSISVASGTACVTTSAGGVKCWGSNHYGQHGNGTKTSSAVSTPVDAVLPTPVAKVVIGAIHVCALTTAGGVKCWGYNGNGRLGTGDTAERLTPVDVPGLESGMANIGLSNNSTCAVTETGAVKCWGSNAAGQAGIGEASGQILNPTAVIGLSSGVQEIAGGKDSICATVVDKSAKCWGSNASGKLGNGSLENKSIPTNVGG